MANPLNTDLNCGFTSEWPTHFEPQIFLHVQHDVPFFYKFGSSSNDMFNQNNAISPILAGDDPKKDPPMLVIRLPFHEQVSCHTESRYHGQENAFFCTCVGH